MSKSSKQGTAVAVTTISLPGPPVAFTIDPKRLCDWLNERHWEIGDSSGRPYRWFIDPKRPGYQVYVPKNPHSLDASRMLTVAVTKAAEAEGISPLVLAELLQGG